MKSIILLLIIALPILAEGQTKRRRMKKKVSYAKGTIFGYWGYNRSGYSNSNITFRGPGYDFTLQGAKANDNPEKFSGVYFNPSKITIPQFNARIGYYFKDHWALSFGYDHMKYILADGNRVFLSGELDPGVHNVYEGTYNAEPIVTNRKNLHYENSDGLNYLRFELTRTDQWLTVGDRDWFAISTNAGVALGGLLSFNDFRLGPTDADETLRTVSMSGYGISGHVSVRLEFWRHLFIQPGLGGGLHHQTKVKTRPNDPSSYARHTYGYFDFNTVVGFLFYIRSKNGCDSCPVW